MKTVGFMFWLMACVCMVIHQIKNKVAPSLSNTLLVSAMLLLSLISGLLY